MPTPECTPFSPGAAEEGVSISVGVLNKNLVVSNKTKRTGEEVRGSSDRTEVTH